MPGIETSRKDWYRLGIIVILGAVLAGCNPEGQAQETKPAITQTIEGVAPIDPSSEVELEEGVEIAITSSPELNEALQETLLIQFENIDGLSPAELETFNNITSEFITLAEAGIENNPDLKEKILTANGPIVSLDANRLIFHEGIWGYSTPEGPSDNPLANTLLMISTTEGSEGELRVCTLAEAANVLGSDFSDSTHFLDFNMINKNSVCTIRDSSNNLIQALTDTTNQWVLAKDSGIVGLGFKKSAIKYGQSALELARTPQATPTPEATPTPTATLNPEEAAEAAQAAIRAEILSYGIDLDDLANSENEWASNHLSIDSIQTEIDDENFGGEKEGYPRTVVIDIEGVRNQEEFEQALVTDGGWKILSYAKLAYKMANGDWQIIKVPLSAYSEEDEVLWEKFPGTVIGQIIRDKERTEWSFRVLDLDTEEGMGRLWYMSNRGWNYHSGTGSFISLFTGWPENPRWAGNDCVLGDPPRYSEEQLIYFRQTGDPSIFGYQDSDGYYIFWPIITFNANLSEMHHYDTQTIMQSKHYDVMEWVKHKDAWLRIKNYEINDKGMIEIVIEFWNRTPEILVFSWNPVINFEMTDNTGYIYEFSEPFENGALNNEEVDFLKDIIWKETSATLTYFDKSVLSANVKTLYLTLKELSVFESVKFELPIR